MAVFISDSSSVVKSSVLGCNIALTNAAESLAYYLNNFVAGSGVRNKTTFSYSYKQTTLPSTLTDAKFIITVVDLQKKRFTKTINIKIIQ